MVVKIHHHQEVRSIFIPFPKRKANNVNISKPNNRITNNLLKLQIKSNNKTPLQQHKNRFRPSPLNDIFMDKPFCKSNSMISMQFYLN